MKWKLMLLLTIALVVYITIGAFIFRALERKPTAGQPVNSTAAYANFTQYLADKYPCLGDAERLEIMSDIINAYDNGDIALPGSIEVDEWELSRSFFFVSTVITTIGYGNVTPVTQGGRIMTVVYALIGIPLCLIFLAGLGENIVKVLKKIEKFCSVCDKCTTLCHVVRVSLLIFAGWVTFIMIPAWIFTYLEDWTYTQSVYFSFVTLSTIGFGDVVPSSRDGQQYPLYRILSILWVYTGLAWLSSLVSLLSDIFQKGVTEGESKMEEHIKKSGYELTSKLKRFGSNMSSDDNKTPMKEERHTPDGILPKEEMDNNNLQTPVVAKDGAGGYTNTVMAEVNEHMVKEANKSDSIVTLPS